jgi:coproporphyrinogen III oxidase-like Fe-S oxidoreductase
MMEGHPLAIDQASAYLRQRPFVTLEDYIQAYKNKLNETQPQELLIRNENIWRDYSLTCMTTFEISRDAIQAASSDAPKVLQLCCWLDRDDIWIPFLKAHKQSIRAGLIGKFDVT